jgi:hypothetical protein
MADPTRSKRIQAIIDRRPGETLRAHAGFLAYLEDRKFSNLVAKGVATSATIYKWADAHGWRDRATEYDAIELEAALEGRTAQRRLAQQILYDGAPEAARRTELTVQDGPNLSREADAMRKLDLETIRRLVRPPDVGAN